MKFRLLLALAALGAAPALLTLHADDSVPAQAPEKKEEKTPLERQMDRIRKAMRKLKKQISDPSQNDSSLALVGTIRDAANRALDLTPAKADDFTGAERDQFISRYRAAMKDFIAEVDRLSAALNGNDNATAAKIYADLPALEKKDHKQFRRPEKS